MRDLDRAIRRKGWSSVATWDDHEVEYWEYTVGFDESLGRPEIIVGGLAPYAGRVLFGPLYSAMKYRVLEPEDGLRWGLEGNANCVFRTVHPSRMTTQWFSLAMHRRQGRGLAPSELKAFQLVTPDRNGVLPWEPGYETAQQIRTPQLWRPPPKHRACRRTRRVLLHARRDFGHPP